MAKGAALMTELELGALLVTRGEHGMTLLRPQQPPLHLPARAREVFDVTGAGDTVISTLAASLAAGEELPHAVALANLAAATANPDGGYLAPNDYDNADDQPNDPGCGLNGQLACTAAQAAQRDLREWRQSLARELPGGRGSIFPVTVGAATEPNGRRVVVMWREKAQLETDTAANLNVDLQDASCPAPAVDGIRCLNLWVTP